MKTIALLFRASRRIATLAIVFSFFSGITSTGLVALIGDGLVSVEVLGTPFFVRFTGIMILAVATNLISRIVLIQLTERSYYELQLHLARRILATPLRKLEQIGPANLLATLSEDVLSVAWGLQKLPSFFMHIAIVASCLVYLFILSPVAIAILLLVMIPAVLSYWAIHQRARKHLRSAREYWDASFNHYRSLTEGSKELKMNTRRRFGFFHQALQPAADGYRQLKILGGYQYEVANAWSQILYFVYILTLFLLVAAVQLSPSILTGFALVALYMRNSVTAIMNSTSLLARTSVALDKINSLDLAADPGALQEDPSAPLRADQEWQTLELRGISHMYTLNEEEEEFELGPLDLTFRPGELVFIVGGNGSGKTTLVKLLVGLYAPQSGQVLLDGIPIEAESEDWFRQHFAVIFSDFFLFQELLGLQRSGLDGLAQSLLRRLHLDQKVTISDGHLSTLDLSHGQRKRLALLTAYLEDRPIYVFDEWAAGQDPAFTDLFYRHLLPELQKRGKLVIVVSHDDRYYHHAGRIIKLDYGQVIYDGPPAAYLQQPMPADAEAASYHDGNGDKSPERFSSRMWRPFDR